MERKCELVLAVNEPSTNTNPAVEYVVSEALRQFQKVMNSSIPPLRLREFYCQEKIKEVAEVERKAVYKKFIPVILSYKGKIMGELVTAIDVGIEKIIEDFQNANEHHKKETHHLIKEMVDFLCEEFKLWLEDQQTVNPDMDTVQRKKIFGDEKARILKFFVEQCSQWNTKLVQKYASQLEEKVTKIERAIEENINQRASTSVASSTASVAEKEKFEAIQERILELCADLQDSWNSDSRRLDEVNEYGQPIHFEKLGRHLAGSVEKVEVVLLDGKKNNFSNPEYQQILCNLMQVLAMATKALLLTNGRTGLTPTKASGEPGKKIAATCINGEDALIWERAFELDLRSTFPSQRSSCQFQSDYQDFEFRFSKVIVKKRCEDIIRKTAEWKREGFLSNRKLQDVVKGLASSFCVEYRSIRGSPKLFLERLFEAWKPRAPEAEEDNGSSPDQGSEDTSTSEGSEENSGSDAEKNDF